MIELSYEIALILMISGLIVGFINTLAAGGSILSITIFMMLGLPANAANGTNRIPVILQNMTSSLNFFRNRQLDVKLGLKLSIPMIMGNVAGSYVAAAIDESILKICLGVIMLLVLLTVLASTDRMLGGGSPGAAAVRPLHYFLLLLTGFYGGYVYVGVGYLILGVALAGMKMDIVRANAIKGFVVLTSAPFALAVFILNGEVNFVYGLIHALGNVAGAFIASQYAVNWGVRFLRLFIVAIIIVSAANLFGIISLKNMLMSVLN